MDIIICGAGEVGQHAAEVLSEGGSNNITIIDLDEKKLANLDETLDVHSIMGSCTQADVLMQAGCATADLCIAATNVDEINLLSASIAKGVGAAQTVARVHHSPYFERRGLDYGRHLGIDYLVCPEYSTAQAIAGALRSPGALAMERFARGKIEMQQLRVRPKSKTVGKMLRELELPGAARVATVQRAGKTLLATAETTIYSDDVVTLVGGADEFLKVAKQFDPDCDRKRRVMVMGATTQAVWLCRALKGSHLAVRLFIADADRAEAIAEKLDWVTVINADPVNTDVLQDERIDQADAFVAVTEVDEKNILGAARAKALGAQNAIAVLQRGTYLHLLEHVGIDRAFSPRATAVTEIQWLLQKGAVRDLATISDDVAHVYEVKIPTTAGAILSKPLRELKPPQYFILAAIQRGKDEVFVPGPTTTIEPEDTVIVIGPPDKKKELRKLMTGK